MRILSIGYALWSQIAQQRGFSLYHIATGHESRELWMGRSEVIFSSSVDPDDYLDWQTNFEPISTGVPTEDEALANILGLGEPLTQTQTDGVPKVAMAPRRGKEAIYATHNYCDRLSWYVESERVTDEVLTETDGLTYDLAHSNIINLAEGKVFDEEGLYPQQPHGYGVVVEVDGVEQIGRAPFASSGGDYHVDHALGRIVFASSQAGKVVTASYSRESGSAWTLTPTTGKCLLVDEAEVQFTDDVDYNTTLVMEVYGAVDYFAPQLMGPPTNLPSGTPIPIQATLYKTIQQIIDEAVGVKPPIPAFTFSDAKRAPQRPMYTFPFRYTVARPLFSSLGMYLRISLQGDVPFGGERTTATFYLMSRTDPGVVEALAELAAE